MTNPLLPVAAATFAAAALAATDSFAQSADDWHFGASLYLYFPSISGRTTFPPPAGGRDVSLDADDVLEDLETAFMGSFEARRGRWGGFADVIYMDLGDTQGRTRSLSIGGIGLPANTSAKVGYDLQGAVWTFAGTYRAVESPDTTLDVLFGTRVLDIRPAVNWQLSGDVGSIPLIDRAGKREVKEQNWDAIVGVRGRLGFGRDGRWFAPYYLDLGTGESSFTWQAMIGVAYSFGWGDITGAWRYTDYQMKSGSALDEIRFNGPAIAATFHW